MMNKLTKVLQLGLAIMVIMGLNSCYKPELEADVPNCIKRKIRQQHRKDEKGESSRVWTWEKEGTQYFKLEIADYPYGFLYNEDCEEICTFGNPGAVSMPNCPGLTDPSFHTLIWEDEGK